MKSIHKNFGVRLDFRDLWSSNDILTLVRNHHLVVLDHVDFAEDKKSIAQYVQSLGKCLDTSDVYKSISKSNNQTTAWNTFGDNIPGLDERMISQRTCGLESHQDGYWYNHKKHVTCSTVYMPDWRPTAGTVFWSSQAAYDSLPQDVKNQLSSLIVSHVHKRDLSWSNRDSVFADLQNKYKNNPERYDRLLRFIKNRGPGRLPRWVNIERLLHSDQMGTWLHFSSSGFPVFLNLPMNQSAALVTMLTDHIHDEKYQYTHHWEKNQLVFWENKTLVHSIEPGYVGNPRYMWRVQFLPNLEI
jgi:alpha-ketoglutarate-dependent taurine dioxygenase